MHLKVKNEPSLVRDSMSKAIINTNEKELSAYKLRRDKDRRVDRLENDVQEIKQMLRQLLEQK